MAPDLAALPSAAASVVRRHDYKRAGSDEPPFAEKFLRWSALRAGIGDREGAAEAILHAAWAADDVGDDGAATALRLRAAAAWGSPRDERSALRLVDVLRRAGQFYDADARAAELEQSANDDTTVRVAAYQRARIAARDTGRHLFSSALRPPARTPHAAHGRMLAEKPGLIGRLFGR